jgi:hypothetical protein
MSKELVPVETKKAVSIVQRKANDLIVSTAVQAEEGSVLLRSIKDAEDGLILRKEEITRPLMKSLSSVRDLFKPLELNLLDAKKTIKAKLLAYQIEQDEKVERERQKIAAKVEKGTMRADTAAGKLEDIGEVEQVKGTQTRTLTKIRIVDETIIPREYLTVNMIKLTDAILHKGIDVPGAEMYEQKILAVA